MQTLPGFRDFLPEDCAARNYIFARWRKVARRYGFVEWDGPVLEATELYRKKSGAEIVDQLFNFTDKGEREVSMRPELTPTLARVVAAHERAFKKPLKWFSIGQFFRYEKQQRGRLREHYQLNCDVIGEDDFAADIELIAVCIDILRSFGLTEEDFVIRISDREFWTDFLRQQKLPAEQWEEVLQVIDKSGREPREKTEEKLGKLAGPVFSVFDKGGRSGKLDRLVDGLGARGLAGFVDIDVKIVRGLAYYTGTVFEVFDRAGKLRAIAGGGRYDNLIAQLSDGAVSMPALGFAMGDVVLGELLRERPATRERLDAAIKGENNIDIYVVIAKEQRRGDALERIQELRDRGYRTDYPLTAEKVGKQFQNAENAGARIALLYGDEWPQVKVKNLATREESLIPSEALLDSVAKFFTVSGSV
ncbi:MAG TPA: ATP phosphoribosyltransferase regulatory subunit [Chthoniobacterales bacterium]|jgi:histidyl-tRNA synthetase|nr:ATP phosphoribosyltransferase regulatory subunit [Chthoniobacterales bacterium]